MIQSLFWQEPIGRVWNRNPKITVGFFGGMPLAKSFFASTWGHLPFSASDSFPLFCSIKASFCPLGNKFSFHLGKTGHDMEEKAPHWGAGVNMVCNTFKVSIAAF